MILFVLPHFSVVSRGVCDVARAASTVKSYKMTTRTRMVALMGAEEGPKEWESTVPEVEVAVETVSLDAGKVRLCYAFLGCFPTFPYRIRRGPVIQTPS